MRWPLRNPTTPAVTADTYDAEPPQISTNSLKANTISSLGLGAEEHPVSTEEVEMLMFVGLAFDSRGFDLIPRLLVRLVWCRGLCASNPLKSWPETLPYGNHAQPARTEWHHAVL